MNHIRMLKVFHGINYYHHAKVAKYLVIEDTLIYNCLHFNAHCIYPYFQRISQVQILLWWVNEPACPQDYVIFVGPFLSLVVLVTCDLDQWEAH